MIQTGFESRIKVQQIIENQLPGFILDESPKAAEFLKQYYISQEYQGGPVDIAENLDQYLNLDNLVPEVIVGKVGLSTNITSTVGVITVTSTKGFPPSYGLLKIDDEVITYTGITTNTFTGCVRGFSGITSYHQDLNREELVFSETSSAPHSSNSTVINLSSQFLQEFYKKLKYTLTPGLENSDFVSDLHVGNFIKESKTLYQTKGTDESFRILFNVLYGETPKVIDLEQFLIKPSSATFIQREVMIAERISGDPSLLVGQTIKKSTDENTSASVSEVEIITRGGKNYYKLMIFVGYDDASPTITGTFNITGSTRLIENAQPNAEIITVDSTIGFAESGTLYFGNNVVSYTSKSINQFFGCTGIGETVAKTGIVRSDETYYGYENGDTTKKVELRLTGVLSNFSSTLQLGPIEENEQIGIKYLGDVVTNPSSNPSDKQIFTNSWIYNTSSRFQISSFNSGAISQVTLSSDIDKSRLKVGDKIDILERDTEILVANDLSVTEITNKQVTTSGNFTLNQNKDYDIRRNIKTSSTSTTTPSLEFDSLFADVQNVYFDRESDYAYVASNSLPSYQITKNTFRYIVSSLSSASEEESQNGLYSIINFTQKVSFLSGSEIYYHPENSPISGLSEGIYYVEVLSDKKQIRLYNSKSFIGSESYVQFGSLTSGEHSFILNNQSTNTISPQKVLRKFPISRNIADGNPDLTTPGSIGMLINGVELTSYKSNEKIYYGPLKSVNVLNGGKNYDVINPPVLAISSGIASIQPIVNGTIERIFVDPQEFNLNTLVSIDITGGNGKGASFQPIIEIQRREIKFDAKQVGNGGGVDVSSETITFQSAHNLTDGQIIYYNPDNNIPLGIGTFNSNNTDQGRALKSQVPYYTKYINNTTIQLYENLNDFKSGINTVGFTTVGTSGIHKFETEPKKILTDVKILNGGIGYENRKLRVNPTGISTINNTINFENHGFNHGELITYTYETTPITTLSLDNQYYVLKVDENSFRLSDAGIGGTDISNYQREKYVKFNNTGSGYQIFNYPEIVTTVNYTTSGIGSTSILGTINAYPVVRGQIVGAYVYNNGSDYGSTILNLHKKPSITVKNGKNAQIIPIVNDGRIIDTSIQYGGIEYYSTPNLKVNGTGSGCILRPVVVDNKITDVVIITSGSGYDSNTTITVEPSGTGVLLDPQVRSLEINTNVFYGIEDSVSGTRKESNELLINSKNNLQYSISGYFQNLQNEFNDNGVNHSPIIGWAYDGNPIYGSYGYSNPKQISPIKKLVSGYTANISNIEDRPSGFDLGFFVDDYKFTSSGDLDVYNGRFCITPEFPNGVYAYFATSSLDIFGTPVGQFPYFVGNYYRSKFIPENTYLNQSFDFNNSKLIRNTFPYNINNEYGGNDFIIESNEIINQRTSAESVTSGSVTNLDIVDGGSDYKVGDNLKFDETGTGGGGLIAQVSKVRGKDIVDLQTTVTSYQDAIFTWKGGNQVQVSIAPQHSIENLDTVTISGFSTSLSDLNGSHQVNVVPHTAILTKDMPAYSLAGVVTDVYVTTIPDNISIGSSITIEQETLSVLNVFNELNVIRVVRESTGLAHTAPIAVNFIPDSFTISHKTDYFDSKVNEKIYFNPKQSVGVGTTPGIGISLTYTVGTKDYQISVPTQSIFIPNHPFQTNQEVTFGNIGAASSIIISYTENGSSYNLPISGNEQKVYIIKKSKDYIGIVTQVGLTTTSNGVFFLNNGSDYYQYSLAANHTQVKGNVDKIKASVSVSTAHGLYSGDLVSLNANPNLSVGIGTSISVYVKYDTSRERLLINPIDFTSSGINTSSNSITINSHNLNTGDKVLYSSSGSVAAGLSTGFYFVYKVDNNRIKLCDTYIDSTTVPPTVVDITSVGAANQKLSPVNPKLNVIKNDNLVFNLSDSSLSGFNFKLYFDRDFTDEFVSTGATTIFSTSGVGTVGVSTNASLTLNYSEELPTKLYYSLEKSGYISTADNEVKDYCEINFIGSEYNGDYIISGVGTTTFNIVLDSIPEKLSYNQSECDTLQYYTNSSTTSGAIKSIRIISGGNQFKKLPIFTGSDSLNGEGAYIICKSNSVGKINQTKILNEGFEYPSDKTLSPKASIPLTLTLSSSNTISNINVLDGGKNYTQSPNLIIVNPSTGEKIDSGFLSPNFVGNGIVSVNIVNEPKGLPSQTVKIASINNTNGVGIQSITTLTSGIATCILVTPLSGFNIEPFAIGDKIYVEGIQQYGTDGDGFNSENYGYEFFTVTNYSNAGTSEPRQLTFSVAGFTTNAGIAKTVQNSYGYIVNYNDYPKFEVVQKLSSFIIGEYLSVLVFGQYVETDLRIVQYNETNIKVEGNYQLLQSNTIRGIQSGSIATIDSIVENYGEFEISYSSRQKIGWSDNVGSLDSDFQVISDNNYYQNLSYSLKSSQTWENIVSPVNNILHPRGLKNFADTEITTSVGFGTTTPVEYTSVLYDIINENRADTINNFDLVLDVDLPTPNSSKSIKFKNKKLTDYIKCSTNRVLQIDDISAQFSSSELNSDITNFSNIFDISSLKKYNRFLIQVSNNSNSQVEFKEIVTINDNQDIFTLEKGRLSNTDIEISDIYGYKDELENYYLKFNPSDTYNTDYKIKVLSNTFNNFETGIGTYSIGFVNLINSNSIVDVGSTVAIVSAPIGNLQSIFSNVHIVDNINNEMNYVELFVDHDGTNTNMSEYYFDSNNDYSSNFIGSFGASISNNIVTLNYTNTSNNQVTLRSKNVGFGSTSIGISTYRFKSEGQPDQNERTVTYNSNYNKVSAASTIVSLNKSLFTSLKSTIRVSIGQTSSLHQVMMIHDGMDVYTSQYPFLSIGSTSGIGTFGGEYNGNLVNLKFYPDSGLSGTFTISSFNESFYTDLDVANVPQDLTYSKITESVSSLEYISVNSENKNRLDFNLKYEQYPIFEKTFDPTNTSILNYNTGEFKITNHFFSTGEELIYTPSSSFSGLTAAAVGIGTTLNSVGIITNILPTKVFAIKINNDIFKLSTRKDYAQAGIYVTFTSVGDGNYHKLEMVKKNEKSIITINNIIQHPITYSLVTYNLGNGGQIGTASSLITLTGISSITTNNLLKIDNEYMKVLNVGFGTTSSGPISFAGTFPLVEVQRGFVGSSATSHSIGTSVYIYSGSFNISGSKIYFTEAPRGTIFDNTFDNLPAPKSYFTGRVFLKNDYSSNQVYDDISTKFTGIGQTYTLTSQGINTVGLTSTGGNGIVLINGIFQTPSTQNNKNNNYLIQENANLGISSIVFSGITSTDGSVVVSNYDINRNQLPRGGMIVSLGSTPGLGFAPLVGASVTATVSSGSIISVGIGTIGNFGSGYRNPVSIAVTDSSHTGTPATITATVGAGGTLAFNIVGGGTGYVNPIINISSPSYENLPVTGVSRLGIGSTTDTGIGLLLNVEVGASSTVGVGSTLFEVTSFKITRPGYGFKKGDVIKPVGLVTARGLTSPINDFTLTVLDTFTDSFSAWQFGELDYIDSIATLQDGKRRRFPLYYNSQLLSFEKDSSNSDSQLIDFDSLLVIFINGILQEPKYAYEFTGGTSFTFNVPPKIEDEVSIFFYRGSSSDSATVYVTESIKPGDDLQVSSNNNILGITTTQNNRVITNIKTSDTIDTNTYNSQGIDIVNYKPTSWTKQKVDRFIDGRIISKSRDSVEPQIYPTAKIIKDFSTTDTNLFVDNAQFFNYENEVSVDFNAFIVSGAPDPVSAAVTAIVSAAGTIQSLSISNGGSGYSGSSVTVKIAAPLTVGVSTSLPMGVGIGIGTVASATIAVSNGSLTTPITITNPGLGYSIGMEPQVIAPLPDPIYENISNVSSVQGFSGSIVGIATTVGIGTALAIKFTLDSTLAPFTGLSVGNPIYIFNTKVGNGVTSIYTQNAAIVGVGTTFLDNIYNITAVNTSTGIITCNIQSNSSVVGIATTGSTVGQFSWGRLSGFTRSSSPISIAVSSYKTDIGLSTFPTIQRRGFGFNNSGALEKNL